MAYVGTVTGPTIKTISGRRYFSYKVVETGASSTSEFVLTGVPTKGTLIYFKATKTSGTATTIRPQLGADTGWSVTGIDHIIRQSAVYTASGGPLIDQTPVRYSLESATDPQKMYGVTVYDAGSDNAGTIELVFLEGYGE